MHATVFKAGVTHASIVPREGGRISLQLQFDGQPGKLYQDFPVSVQVGIKMKDDDPVFRFIKTNVRHVLETTIEGKNTKENLDAGLGQSPAWLNCIVDKELQGDDMFQTNFRGLSENEKAVKQFIRLMEASHDCLPRRGKGGTEANIRGATLKTVLLDDHRVSDSNTSLRMLIVTNSSSFKVHNDANHLENSANSIIFHLKIFYSKNYRPGSIHDGPWIFLDENEKIARRHRDPYLYKVKIPKYHGYIGERRVVYCTSRKTFIEGTELMAATKRKTDLWDRNPSRHIMRDVLGVERTTSAEEVNRVWNDHFITKKTEKKEGTKRDLKTGKDKTVCV